MRYNIRPFPAVRVNGKGGRFSKRAKEYHNKMNELRRIICSEEYTLEDIMKALINGNYDLRFYFEIKGKVTKKMPGTYHTQSPDIDNLYKAFTDTIFYGNENYNDREIAVLRASKYWYTESFIEFIIL